MFKTTPRRNLFGPRTPDPAPIQNDAQRPAQASTPADPGSPQAAPVSAAELGAHIAARLCHDFISPAGAITSGLDLLDDPSASDMREEAMGLIQSSARKLVELLAFCRVAFGASASAETFDVRTLETLTRGVYAHVRPELVWSVDLPSVNKAAARALLNMAQLAAGALPTGGATTVNARVDGDQILVIVEARSNRVRLRPEVISGLNGERLDGGLGGQWVQAFYLNALVHEAGGVLKHHLTEDTLSIFAKLPA
jgi:histidine phosphotransferase ChpT